MSPDETGGGAGSGSVATGGSSIEYSVISASSATGATDRGSGVAGSSATEVVGAASAGKAVAISPSAGAFVTSAQPTATRHHNANNPHRRVTPPINFVILISIGMNSISPNSARQRALWVHFPHVRPEHGLNRLAPSQRTMRWVGQPLASAYASEFQRARLPRVSRTAILWLSLRRVRRGNSVAQQPNLLIVRRNRPARGRSDRGQASPTMLPSASMSMLSDSNAAHCAAAGGANSMTMPRLAICHWPLTFRSVSS